MELVKSNIVSTDEFWQLMGLIAFMQISKHKGVLYGRNYYCTNPPDDEFIKNKLEETAALLEVKPFWKRLFNL